MPALTIERIDLDAAGLLLAVEVEEYLRQVAQSGETRPEQPFSRLRENSPATGDHRYSRHGSTVQHWAAGYPQPTASLLDRLRHRPALAAITPADHLRLISRYITAHGWTQGSLWSPSGAVCVLGAQIRVLAAGYGGEATARRARELLGNELGYAGFPMPVDNFNDLPTTRQADVHRLLERAAAR